jgi:hypothetical protein
VRTAWLALAVLWLGCVAGKPVATVSPAAQRVRVLLLGDFGEAGLQQEAVVRAMAAQHAKEPFDLALALGDNIYDCGPDHSLAGAEHCTFTADQSSVSAGFVAPVDSRFEIFERPLQGLTRGGSPVPVWVALGNHDVGYAGSCFEHAGSAPGSPAFEREVSQTALINYFL